jgi:DNA modification methylase
MTTAATTTSPTDVPMITWHGCYDQSWRGLMTAEAFAHPAKFAPGLIDRIYQHGFNMGWWYRGSTIGDPFGGVAGGGIYAGYHGLGWVGVELEERFVTLGNANLELHRAKWVALGVPVGRIRLVQGDSRKFSDHFITDAIVTSPPYADSIDRPSGIDATKFAQQRFGPNTQALAGTYGSADGQIGSLRGGPVDAVLTSPPYNPGDKADGTGAERDPRGDRMRGCFRSSEAYGKTPGQIGRLAGGGVDAVLTSPPYSDGLGHGGGRPIHQPGRPGDVTLQGQKDGYGATAGQIGELTNGSIDAVITSPPYADTPLTGERNFKSRFQPDEKSAAANAREGYGKTPGQISNLSGQFVDAVVTSPPYEGIRQDGAGINADASSASPTFGSYSEGQTDQWRTQRDQVNIGNQAGETYWQAMHQVYRQCGLAMKPGGVMAVVVKDYVKDKQRVPLCDQTLRLLVHLGFEPVVRVHAMLVKETRSDCLFGGPEHVKRTERKSFFRRLAEKKGSPRIDWEEVLVVRKAVLQ